MRPRFLPVLALVCAGCAGYRLGPVQPTFMKDVKTVAAVLEGVTDVVVRATATAGGGRPVPLDHRLALGCEVCHGPATAA